MFRLIVRPGCHLCDQAENSLRALEKHDGLVWTVIDIDSDPSFAQYSDRVPVLLDSAGRVLAELTSSPAALRRAVKPPWWRRFIT